MTQSAPLGGGAVADRLTCPWPVRSLAMGHELASIGTNHTIELTVHADYEAMHSIVEMLAGSASSSHIYVAGVGKSGYVAARLAASFRTIGCAASFIDPSGALHGELGTFRSSDVLIILSASAESDELVELHRHAKTRLSRTVLVTREGSTALARDSSHVITYTRERIGSELLPTADSVSQVLIGDHVCELLAKKLVVAVSDVSANHPNGTHLRDQESGAS